RDCSCCLVLVDLTWRAVFRASIRASIHFAIRLSPISWPFPYTTLFRSVCVETFGLRFGRARNGIAFRVATAGLRGRRARPWVALRIETGRARCRRGRSSTATASTMVIGSLTADECTFGVGLFDLTWRSD